MSRIRNPANTAPSLDSLYVGKRISLSEINAACSAFLFNEVSIK